VDFFAFKKNTVPKFSLRIFADLADFSSHSHVKYIIEGRRNLSKKTLFKMVKGLELTGIQADYFEKLVFFNQAKTLEEAQFYYQKLLSYTSFKKLDMAQLTLYEDWYHTVIRELVALKLFRSNPDWIGNQLIPKVSGKNVAQSLKLLLSNRLIIRTANGFRQTDRAITTDDEVKSLIVKRYHSNMIELAKQALDQLPQNRRDISSVTFAIKAADFQKIKKHLQIVRKELMRFATEGMAGEGIVQVNIQLFPLTEGI
jgi:uncharacterized protein (TIGR02147 family)